MKLAILSESHVDEAAVRILVNGILARETETVARLRTPPGWPSVLQVVPKILLHLHYQTNADALVVVADSDNSPVHNQAHEELERTHSRCRLCQLRAAIVQAQKKVRVVEGRPPLKTAVGVAVPAIEAWYLCGLDPQATEAAFMLKPISSLAQVRSDLKQRVYGTSRSSSDHQLKRATEEARRLTLDLEMIERLFPNGFGVLAKEVRSWLVGVSN